MQVIEGKVKAMYSQAQFQAANPMWKEVDLPPLIFKASLPELVKESIVVHATHKGKMVNTTLVRANLLFRSLVANGKSFAENDLITFQVCSHYPNRRLVLCLISFPIGSSWRPRN
jgi:hypothetical protein